MFDATKDWLATVFTREVLNRLSAEANPSWRLENRIRVLTAHGPLPVDDPMATSVRYWRAQRAAWDAYVSAAAACGVLDGTGGADVIARLASADDDQFRSAMAECMACWFLAGKLKMHVRPRPSGAVGKVPDLLVTAPEGDMTVEVKAPYTEPVTVDGTIVGTETWAGTVLPEPQQADGRCDPNDPEVCCRGSAGTV